MKKLILAVMLLGLAAILMLSAPAQAGTTSIAVGTANCGATALPNLNCYQLPLKIGGVQGTAWIDVQGQAGFILFRPALEGANYVEGAITAVTNLQVNNIGQVTSATISFTIADPSANGYTADPDHNGDADSVQGSITISATYYRGCSSGRVGGCRWLITVTGGSGTQSMPQD